MTLSNHLAELERKHDALEREIQAATTSPATDDVKVAALKRRKLQLKDELSRLRRPAEQVR